MNTIRPTPSEERWLRIAARTKRWRDPWILVRINGWRASSLLSRCVFFVLGLVAAILVAGILSLLKISAVGVAGVVLLVFAEWLILRRGLFGAGIEESLEISGLLMIGVQITHWTSASQNFRLALMGGVIFLIAGIRLLNPLFVTLSLAVLSAAITFLIEARFGTAKETGSIVAGLFCWCMAWLALLAGNARFQRPSHDRMLDWAVVAMPVAGYLWFLPLHQQHLIHMLPLLMLAGYAPFALIAGIGRRAHAPLIGFLLCIACMAFELRNLTDLLLRTKLILWGSIAFSLAFALDRYLRAPRGGITSEQFAENRGSLDLLLQLPGAGALAPQAPPAPPAPFHGGGGTSGGGGASGSY